MPQKNQIRIIGGHFRGRKLHFADLPGLRPSGDRVRETLFNWLQAELAGARCLDLFAGSGALGLEAVSRGAGQLVLVDRSALVVRQLRDNLALLGLDNARVLQQDSIAWLRGPAVEAFDLVFLDPPFSDGLLSEALDLLPRNGWLRPHALVYLENDASQGLPKPPVGWTEEKQKRMGRVIAALYRYSGGLD